MHFSGRTYTLLTLIALLAIAGTWAADPAFSGVWRWPAALLLLGLAFEARVVRRTVIHADVDTHTRACLGRPQPAAFVFRNDSARPVLIEYAPVTPPGVEPLGQPRKVLARRRSVGRDNFTLTPIRLGRHSWPALPARLRGPLGLAWWSRQLPVSRELSVAPDTLGSARCTVQGNPAGTRAHRMAGSGSELYQLRAYVPGDPIARIDWKATARTGSLITRELSEDLHLDVVIAVDAGRFSRVRTGRLDRYGRYANAAARFAEVAVANDDRIGLVVFSDRVLAVCSPGRGLPAVTRIRRTLESLDVQPAESDPIAAAARIRSLLGHRGLVVLLTDLDDPSIAEQLARAVRLLSPPHFVVVAGVSTTEIEHLAHADAVGWRDPWIALAAQEHQLRAHQQRLMLRRLGAPVVVARADQLDQAVIAEYEAARQTRRI